MHFTGGVEAPSVSVSSEHSADEFIYSHCTSLMCCTPHCRHEFAAQMTPEPVLHMCDQFRPLHICFGRCSHACCCNNSSLLLSSCVVFITHADCPFTLQSVLNCTTCTHLHFLLRTRYFLVPAALPAVPWVPQRPPSSQRTGAATASWHTGSHSRLSNGSGWRGTFLVLAGMSRAV